MENSAEMYEVEVSEIADATESTQGYDFRGTYEITTTDYREV
ncbi:hypothetical protein [Pantoea dispersa]|nr:hypothetical protein [Pantoea dispersa]